MKVERSPRAHFGSRLSCSPGVQCNFSALFQFPSESLAESRLQSEGEQFVGLTPRKSSGQWHLHSDSLSPERVRNCAPEFINLNQHQLHVWAKCPSTFPSSLAFPLFLFELILQSNKFDTVRAQISEFGERFITRALREVPRAK